MKNKPNVAKFEDGSKMWEHRFDTFSAKVYVPANKLPEDIINFGFEAPYLICFTDVLPSDEDAVRISKEKGFYDIAVAKATSVVYVSPNTGSFKTAPDGLFEELIKNSKIHQYHEDGMAVLVNRFTHTTDGYAIRGAIFRTFIYGCGDAADYIATHLLKTITGEGLWGPADVIPAGVVLEKLSVKPDIERRDMPIASIGNSAEINKVIEEGSDKVIIKESLDFKEVYEKFLKHVMRWGWVGTLTETPDFEKLNMKEEFAYATVKTSPDNEGDDKGTKEHKVGYVAYYNKKLFDNGPVPLLLAFHGGGDSAMYIAQVSEWYRVAHDHNFLLVSIENHLNSTATEMMELIEHLKGKYSIDSERIYASGFSMGGCKSWDMYQEYPEVFAGLAPMDATFELGLNVFGKASPVEINKDVMVPVFYSGGEITPLPELPFQAQKCFDRIDYVLKVNDTVKRYDTTFEDRENWGNKIWGIDGDEQVKEYDSSRESTLTIELFKSKDGNVYTALSSVSDQGHECRYHTCENAWKFISRFKRVNGKIEIIK